jgi:CheY-like chemotaxis protein
MSNENITNKKTSVLSGVKVLFAEDDASMRRFVEITLKQAGLQVFAVEDGLAAMKFALENEIDVVVADAIMPNLSGYDLCRMLRGNPDKKHIPFIILSGLKQDDSKNDCLADIYLLKDDNLKQTLIKTLKNLLSNKSNS